MQKKFLKVVVFLIASLFGLVISLIFYNAVNRLGYYYTVESNSPFKQKNTQWISDCGRASFIVNEKGRSAVGKITLYDGTVIQTYFKEDTVDTRCVWVYDFEDVHFESDSSVLGGTVFRAEKHIEIWKHRYYKNRFVAIVKESTYFEEGERLVFRRVDDQ